MKAHLISFVTHSLNSVLGRIRALDVSLYVSFPSLSIHYMLITHISAHDTQFEVLEVLLNTSNEKV